VDQTKTIAPPSRPQPQPPRTLGFGDLVLFYVVTGVSLRWIATAAAAGPSSITIWVLAWLTFFLPLALSVIELSSRHPDEGGLYVWSKRAFGDFAGEKTLGQWRALIRQMRLIADEQDLPVKARAPRRGGDLQARVGGADDDKWLAHMVIPFTRKGFVPDQRRRQYRRDSLSMSLSQNRFHFCGTCLDGGAT